MMVLYIILGILLFLIVALLIPLRFKFSYGTELQLTVHYLFFRYILLPTKEEKPKATPKQGKPTKKIPEKKLSIIDKIRALVQRKGVGGFLSLMKSVSVLLGGILKELLVHLRIKRMDIYFLAAAEDAASAAMLYGEACAAIYPTVSALCEIGRCKNCGVTVDLDYHQATASVAANCTGSILPVFFVQAGVKLLCKGIPILQEFK
ncbi:MAG: hypothetical protein RSC76_03655 [Oscillospiraceae bacterium]